MNTKKECTLLFYFQLVTTNEKLEMQIRNLNKTQNNSPCVQRSNALSLDEKGDSQNDVKKSKIRRSLIRQHQTNPVRFY